MSNGLFAGRNQIVYGYGRYGYTRGGGKTWHGGVDIVGLDSNIILMPYYHEGDKEIPIKGTVRQARIVTDKSNNTWEWGYYVSVEMDGGQTPDEVNWLYFCHCSKLLVKQGDRVISGQQLAIMGNTGNAALNDPPYSHVHFEARATATGKSLDPTAYSGIPNTVGTYTMDGNTNGGITMTQIKAIDVSKHQGTIDWKSARNSGIQHAIIRAGYGSYLNQKDPKFDANVKGCEDNGINWGAYWYSYAESVEEARQEARIFLQVVKGLKPTMPLVYDMEYEPGILALDNATRTAMVKAFLGELEAAGYYAMLYCSTNFLKTKLNYKELTSYDIWAAQYGPSCNSPLPYGIWQYSSTGSVPGISGNVDLDIMYKDYPKIIKNAGLNGWPKTEGNQPGGDGETGGDREPAGETTTPKMQMPVITGLNSTQLTEFASLAAQLQLDMGIEHTAKFQAVTQGDADKILAKTRSLGLEGKYTSSWV